MIFREFKEFAMRGNVVDMAIGIIIGAAFGSIVNSMVTDLLTPAVSRLMGKVDLSNIYLTLKNGNPAGPYSSVMEAKKAGAITMNFGLFLNQLINFLFVAFPVFLLVRQMNRLRRKEVPPPPVTTRECPFCLMLISNKAVRCPHCTSQLEGPA